MESDQKQPVIAIIGVGLMGSSLGLALHSYMPDVQVVGFDKNTSHLEAALRLGAIDHEATDLASAIHGASLAFLALPVDVIADVAVEVLALSSDIVVTDMGSTKADISIEVSMHKGFERFVPGHPLAGDHHTGPQHGRADLFRSKKVVLTPTEETSVAAVGKVERLWQNVGAEVITLSPEEHDQRLAATSHAPHLLAVALANATPTGALPCVASGWLDSTRIAAASPTVWMPIFRSNRTETVDALKRIIESAKQLQEALSTTDDIALHEQLSQAQQGRHALGN